MEGAIQLGPTLSTKGDAEQILVRELKADQKAYGKKHPRVGCRLNNLAVFHHKMLDIVTAEKLYRHALSIFERRSGPGHRRTIISDKALLRQLKSRRIDVDAASNDPCTRKTGHAIYGSEQGNVIVCLINLALLLNTTYKYPEGIRLMNRALFLSFSNPSMEDAAWQNLGDSYISFMAKRRCRERNARRQVMRTLSKSMGDLFTKPDLEARIA